jgi:tetratricopeptide (TPR) repeat protein
MIGHETLLGPDAPARSGQAPPVARARGSLRVGSRAAEELKLKKITRSQYVQVEEEAARRLAETIRKEIAVADTLLKSNWKYFDLGLIARERKAQCHGYAQLFYVLGNAVGLTVRGVNVQKHFQGPMPDGAKHVVCIADFDDGRCVQVDITLKDKSPVSRGFVFAEEYGKDGNYWKLRKQESGLDIHPRIQLLDGKGLVAGAHNHRGIAHCDAGKYSEAVADYAKAIELDPKDAYAYLSRAFSYATLGRSEDAKKDLRKAMQLDPSLKEKAKKTAAQFKLEL